MSGDSGWESMQDMFIFETLQLMEQLEQLVLASEKGSGFVSCINDIFRIMHTIKGNSAMMQVDHIAVLAHKLEDIFYWLRENKPLDLDYSSLADILLKAIDFIKHELTVMKQDAALPGNAEPLIELSRDYLDYINRTYSMPAVMNDGSAPELLKPPNNIQPEKAELIQSARRRYRVVIFFQENCGMENVRAYLLLHKLEELAVEEIKYLPADIAENEASSEQICNEGFQVEFVTALSSEEVLNHLQKTAFIENLILHEMEPGAIPGAAVSSQDRARAEPISKRSAGPSVNDRDNNHQISRQAALISVNIVKLDRLMDLVGELVIAEAMVTQNPELTELNLNNFFKASRQLRKITHDLQDTVMSIRMVPLTMIFQKMHRIVRDMSHSLNKQVQLELFGEETEVDKNIIEQISDPLIHLIRNAVDHGIENIEERRAAGKPETGLIKLEAKNAGGDVWIVIKDDGRGLNQEKILQKAHKLGLVSKNESELTEREIYSYILQPGFSTKAEVSEFSGRGVGMDVVNKNIAKIGGNVLVDSIPGLGTTVSLKIPLTLAIIDGMVIKAGKSSFTLPMTSIKESFRFHENDIITDPAGNEMILIRGEAYSVLRLHQMYRLDSVSSHTQKGIIIMVEYEGRSVGLLADELIGEQQVVIKPLPEFVQRIRSRVRGISSCTLLGDGTISLILDVAGLFNNC